MRDSMEPGPVPTTNPPKEPYRVRGLLALGIKVFLWSTLILALLLFLFALARMIFFMSLDLN